MPVGRGSRYVATNAHGVAGAFINDWTLSWVFQDQTGFPVALKSGYQYTCTTSYTPVGGPTHAEWINNGNGNPSSCWQPVSQFAVQTLPQQISTLRQPSIPNLGLSLHKVFSLTEAWKLQFRAEAFNIANTPLFPAPDTNPGDKIGSPTGTPVVLEPLPPLRQTFLEPFS